MFCNCGTRVFFRSDHKLANYTPIAEYIVADTACRLYINRIMLTDSSKIDGWKQSKTQVFIKTITTAAQEGLRKADIKQGEKIIEEQYLFIWPDGRVLVISNIPSRDKKLYTMKSNLADGGEVINPWNFGQFRFGTIEKASNNFTFKTANDATQHWKFNRLNNGFHIESVAIVSAGEQLVRTVDAAITIKVDFLEAGNHAFDFARTKQDQAFTINLVDNKIRVMKYKNDWRVVLQFIKTAGNDKTKVVYKGARLYALP